VGWRYLITNAGPIAVADVKESAQGTPRFGSLIRGQIAERFEQAAELADQSFSGDEAEFEVRVLEIPALYITALWLHGPRDILVPFFEGVKNDKLPVQVDPSFVSRVLQNAVQKKQMP
jgi:hypothetical protein